MDAGAAGGGYRDAALASLGSAGGRALYLAVHQVVKLVRSPSRKTTLAELQWRVDTGLWRVIMPHGRFAKARQTADNDALLMLLRSADAFVAQLGHEG